MGLRHSRVGTSLKVAWFGGRAPLWRTAEPSDSGRAGKRRRRLVQALLALAIVPLLLIVDLRLQFGFRIRDITRDVAAVADVHPLSGALSSLGILMWCSAASIWLFAAAIHRASNDARAARFAAASGTLSAYFALDDLFQIHEHLAPTYLGLPEAGVYFLLGLATVAYLWLFRSRLARNDAVLLFASLAFLGGSVSIDVLLEPWLWRIGDWTYLIEDGLKWLGIVCWLGFCLVRCWSDLIRLAGADAVGSRGA